MDILKNEKTIESEFDAMLSLAKGYFETNYYKKYEFHQCLVLSAEQGEPQIYSLYSDSIKELIDQGCAILAQLEKEGVTVIKKIVCMWEGNAIDVPSFQFMKKLCELNPENKKTKVLLNAGGGAYTTKKIADMIG